MTGSRAGRRLLVTAAALLTVPLAVLSTGGVAQAAPNRHPIPNSKPRWLNRARQTGTVKDADTVDFGVLLGMRNSAGAEAILQNISDPDAAGYGNWLSRGQFLSRYAPAAGDVTAVRSWLTAQGFTDGDTLGGAYVQASGTTAAIEKTFSTTLDTYSFQGQLVHANTTDLSLPSDTPAAVTGAVEAVTGLDQGASVKKPAATVLPGPPEGFRTGVQPCSAYYGQKTATTLPSYAGKKQPYTVCGYGPQQYQSAYGESGLLDSGVTGKGVTVAITDAFAAPTILADAQKYNKVHGQPQFAQGQFRQILPSRYDQPTEDQGGDELIQGWYGEETLDVEAVHAMAPGAKIVYVGGSNQVDGLDNAWAKTIDDHVADIVTDSWTFGDADAEDPGAATVAFFRYFSLEAALTGQTVLFSSGDSGDNTSGGTDPASRLVAFPNGLPWITSVGGTSIAIGRSGDRRDEWGWQNAYLQLSDDGTSWVDEAYSSGGGGGVSTLFAEPWYQKGVVPDAIAAQNGGRNRAVPDISAAGDPNTGFLVGETQVFPDGTYWDQYRIGGTSLSSPLMAGAFAVASQKAGRPLGFVNPAVYGLGSKAIFDVVAPKKPTYAVRTDFVNGLDAADGLSYRLEHLDVQTSTLHSTPGYDTETGVGSPQGPAFFTALAKRR